MNTFFRILGVAITAFAVQTTAQAVDLSQYGDLESRHRSKIVKMKAKQATEVSQSYNFLAGSEPAEAECGSQNIGNVSGTGRAGPQPREIFVFAPGAINLVNGRGCR